MAGVKHIVTSEGCHARGYSGLQVFLANLPYALMVLLGTAILVLGLGLTPWSWIAAAAYAAYGVGSAIWIMAFVCPHCPLFGGHMCPCGYGAAAARFRSRGDVETFAKKFRRHIPLIVPLWFIPVLTAFGFTYREFSWPLVGLLAAFAIDAFVVLPIYSKKHGCELCTQRDRCPWMGGKKNTG